MVKGFSLGALFITAALALPSLLWPGLLLGALLAFWLLRTRYREQFLLFSGLPGLYVFLGADVTLATDMAREGWLLAFTHWGLLTLALLLLGFAASSMAQDARFAPLWALPLAVIQPEGIVLAGIVLAQVLWTLERQALKPSRAFLLGMLLLLLPLVIGLSGILLPRLSFQEGEAGAPGAVQDEPLALPPAEGEMGQIIYLEPELSPWAQGVSDLLQAASAVLYPLALLVGLALLIFLVVVMLRQKPNPLQWHWRQLVPLLALCSALALLGVWFVLSLGGADGELGSFGEALPPPMAPGLAEESPIIEREVPGYIYDITATFGLVVTLMAFVGLALVVLLLIKLWLSERQRQEDEEAEVVGRSRAPEEQLSSRVRRAYRDLLRRMRAQGYGRQFWESPSAYAARLGMLRPEAGEPLKTITALYEAVRYGEASRESEAEEAERLCSTIPQLFKEAKA